MSNNNTNTCKIKECENERCSNQSYYCEHHYYFLVLKKRKPLYLTWKNIKQRCYNPSSVSYKYYGGRGIKMCERWKNDYNLFAEDMGDKPKGCSLDRIDPNGDYEPNNCRWVDYTQQNYNQRVQKNNKSGCTGVYKKRDKWQSGIYYKRRYINLGAYTELEDAVKARKLYERKLII